MMIFWRAGLVLLAVPKTGSEALQEALWPHADLGVRFPPRMRHMNLSWFERRWASALPPGDRYRLETVAVVREPVDWLASWYRYRRREDVAGKAVSTRGVSFDAFVEAWLDDAPPDHARVGRQSRFCTASDGTQGIDHLFAYEAPDAFHGFLGERLGVAVDPPRRNVSPKGDTGLSDRLRARLRDEAAAEFALHASARR